MYTKYCILFCSIILVSVACSGNKPEQATDDQTKIEGNISTIFSTDKAKLAKLINLEMYEPDSVKFKHWMANNAGENGRSIPGPSDETLQAIMYYDSLTFNRVVSNYSLMASSFPNINNNEFDFEWLDKNIHEELMTMNDGLGAKDNFFSSKGKVWFLKKKNILLYKYQNN